MNYQHIQTEISNYNYWTYIYNFEPFYFQAMISDITGIADRIHRLDAFGIMSRCIHVCSVWFPIREMLDMCIIDILMFVLEEHDIFLNEAIEFCNIIEPLYSQKRTQFTETVQSMISFVIFDKIMMDTSPVTELSEKIFNDTREAIKLFTRQSLVKYIVKHVSPILFSSAVALLHDSLTDNESVLYTEINLAHFHVLYEICHARDRNVEWIIERGLYHQLSLSSIFLLINVAMEPCMEIPDTVLVMECPCSDRFFYYSHTEYLLNTYLLPPMQQCRVVFDIFSANVNYIRRFNINLDLLLIHAAQINIHQPQFGVGVDVITTLTEKLQFIMASQPAIHSICLENVSQFREIYDVIQTKMILILQTFTKRGHLFRIYDSAVLCSRLPDRAIDEYGILVQMQSTMYYFVVLVSFHFKDIVTFSSLHIRYISEQSFEFSWNSSNKRIRCFITEMEKKQRLAITNLNSPKDCIPVAEFVQDVDEEMDYTFMSGLMDRLHSVMAYDIIVDYFLYAFCKGKKSSSCLMNCDLDVIASIVEYLLPRNISKSDVSKIIQFYVK